MKLPLLLEMTGQRALVVGLGRVGRRRAENLVACGCQVTAIDKADTAAIPETADGVDVICKDYDASMLDGVTICVAATSDHALNHQVLTDCKARHIPVNAADDPDHSDFFFPSVIRRGDLTLSVCTEGASPYVTKEIVAHLKAEYGPEIGDWLQNMKIAREYIKATTPNETEKRAALKALTTLSPEELATRVARGDYQ